MKNTATTNLPARAGYVRKQRRYRRQVAAVKTANKGRKQTKGHREAIKASMRQFAADEKTVVKAKNLTTGEEVYFPTGADCARYIGCTKQLVSRAIRGTQRSRTARGWLIERVPFSEILPNEIVLVDGKLLGVSCRQGA